MPTPIIVRGIGSRRYKASEYAILEILLSGNIRRLGLIEREFYIVDDLSVKALVGVDILKPEDITINFVRDIMVLGAYDNMVVLITVYIRSPGPRTNATVFAQKQMTIQPRSIVAIPITGPRYTLDLPQDRDLFFELAALNELSTYAYIVDYILTEVFIRNNTDKAVTLQRRLKLGNITELDTTEYYTVSSDNYNLAIKAPKRVLRRVNYRNAIVMNAAFAAAIGEAKDNTETVYCTGVTIYGLLSTVLSIVRIVELFLSLWEDTGNARISKSDFIEIPLVNNWTEIYKLGQAKVYPVGKADKDIIDIEFDKLYR